MGLLIDKSELKRKDEFVCVFGRSLGRRSLPPSMESRR